LSVYGHFVVNGLLPEVHADDACYHELVSALRAYDEAVAAGVLTVVIGARNRLGNLLMRTIYPNGHPQGTTPLDAEAERAEVLARVQPPAVGCHKRPV